MPKPILLRVGWVGNRIYAVRAYKERGNGMVVSSAKEDVTAQAIEAVIEHAQKCAEFDCMCQPLRAVAISAYHRVNLVDPA